MAYDDRALVGVGGWLAFFVLTLAVFGPLRGLSTTYATLYGTPDLAIGYATLWPLVQLFEWSVFLLGAGMGIYLAWRLVYRQNRETLSVVRGGIWIAAFAPLVIEVGGIALISGQPLCSLLAALPAEIARPLIYCAIWTAYLYRSQRVANTYTPDPDGTLGTVFD